MSGRVSVMVDVLASCVCIFLYIQTTWLVFLGRLPFLPVIVTGVGAVVGVIWTFEYASRVELCGYRAEEIPEEMQAGFRTFLRHPIRSWNSLAA